MLHLLLYILLFLCLIASLAILFVNLPGLWLMVLAAAVYSVLIRPILTFPSFRVLMILLGLAAAAEVADFFAAGAGAKRAGGTRRGLWGAIIGSVVGAIVGSFVLPLVLTLVGVCIGTFVGAWIGEVSGGQEIGRSVRIAVFATIGRLAGTVGKLVIGSIMLLITMFCAWPWRHAAVAGTAAIVKPNAVSAPPAVPSHATLPASAASQNDVRPAGWASPTTPAVEKVGSAHPTATETSSTVSAPLGVGGIFPPLVLQGRD